MGVWLCGRLAFSRLVNPYGDDGWLEHNQFAFRGNGCIQVEEKSKIVIHANVLMEEQTNLQLL